MASKAGIKQLTLMMLAIGIPPEECHDAAQELYRFLTTPNEYGTDIQIEEAITDWIGLSDIVTQRTADWCDDNFAAIVDTVTAILYGNDPMSVYLRTGERIDPPIGFIGSTFNVYFDDHPITNIGTRQPDTKMIGFKKCTSMYYFHGGELRKLEKQTPRFVSQKGFKKSIVGAIELAAMLGAK